MKPWPREVTQSELSWCFDMVEFWEHLLHDVLGHLTRLSGFCKVMTVPDCWIHQMCHHIGDFFNFLPVLPDQYCTNTGPIWTSLVSIYEKMGSDMGWKNGLRHLGRGVGAVYSLEMTACSEDLVTTKGVYVCEAEAHLWGGGPGIPTQLWPAGPTRWSENQKPANQCDTCKADPNSRIKSLLRWSNASSGVFRGRARFWDACTVRKWKRNAYKNSEMRTNGKGKVVQ